MRIDSHQHFWRYNPQRDHWITDAMPVLQRNYLPKDLLPILRSNGIAGCVAVQADQSEEETLFLLGLANQAQEIRGVVGWVDLCALGLPERLQYFSQFEKLCGFRHIVQAEPDDRYMLRPEFCRGIRHLWEFDFTYDILIYPKQLPAAIELVARFPEQRFVVDHMAKPSVRTGELASWAVHMRAISENPNVYCKLSGLVTEADCRGWCAEDFTPYLDVVFEAFGAGRLMFGSDWPVCLLAASYQQTKSVIDTYTAGLAPEQRDRIFGGNAVRFYSLKGSNDGPTTQG